MNDWIEIAEKVLRGEFNKADHSTIESIKIGLKGTEHPLCKQALTTIENLKPKKFTQPKDSTPRKK